MASTATAARKAGDSVVSITTARSNLEAARNELAVVESGLANLETEIQKAYTSGNTAALKTLRPKRDALWARRDGLTRDVEAATVATRQAEQAQAAEALQREVDALEARYREMAPQLDAALEAMAKARAAINACYPDYTSLSQRIERHRRQYGEAPQLLSVPDLVRMRAGFLQVFDDAQAQADDLTQHRTFLGKARTLEEAERRQQAKWAREAPPAMPVMRADIDEEQRGPKMIDNSAPPPGRWRGVR